jgi:hypothetical protein
MDSTLYSLAIHNKSIHNGQETTQIGVPKLCEGLTLTLIGYQQRSHLFAALPYTFPLFLVYAALSSKSFRTSAAISSHLILSAHA